MHPYGDLESFMQVNIDGVFYSLVSVKLVACYRIDGNSLGRI